MFLNYMFSYFLPYAILSYKCILKVFAAHAKAGAKRFQEYIQIERRKKFPRKRNKNNIIQGRNGLQRLSLLFLFLQQSIIILLFLQ